jgi:membrane associated rhomboid family serine protease
MTAKTIAILGHLFAIAVALIWFCVVADRIRRRRKGR